MSGTARSVADLRLWSSAAAGARWLEVASHAAAEPLLFGLRLWVSVSLALYAAFWLQLDNPFWAGASAAIVCQPQLGASLRKGWFRMLGTLVGAIMSIVLVACFAQNRFLFLGCLALWAAACAFLATLLRNFASYAASLAGYTAAIIAGDLLGTVGGVDANAAFLLAVSRATEICLGIVCAGVVLAGTDLGGARRRLAAVFAELAGGITSGLVGTLAAAGNEGRETRAVQRDFLRRAIALDPIVDQALGESSQVRYHSPVLRRAVDGLFSALAGWYAAADHLTRLPASEAQPAAAILLENVPQEFRAATERNRPARWLTTPTDLLRTCKIAAGRFASLPAGTPSVQLLADNMAKAFTGMADALNGLALLVGDLARPDPGRGIFRLRVPDWLPALVGAGRTFVTVGAVALFWIVSGWPGGALAMTFAAIVELLLAPRADETYGAALLFAIGAILDLILTATVAFAVLPGLPTDGFAAFSLAIGACLIPIGALLRHARQPWQVGLLTAMTMGFVPILQPTNPETYNPEIFYNVGFAIVAGMATAALSFRLMPPLSPAFRTRRLLALTLRDLRRLAKGRPQNGWEGHVIGRLSVMPAEATPPQRTQLLAALSVGSEIIRLRSLMPRLGLEAALDEALGPVVQGDTARAIARLASLDATLANHPELQAAMRARGSIGAISEALPQHADYFDGGAPR
jgi:uncharacterized membrane protein YccC